MTCEVTFISYEAICMMIQSESYFTSSPTRTLSMQIVSETFPSGFAVKEGSTYKGVIRKRQKKRKPSTQVKADTLKLKMKDILEKTFRKLGNSVSFYIYANKYTHLNFCIDVQCTCDLKFSH